jgi:hypothetical protein
VRPHAKLTLAALPCVPLVAQMQYQARRYGLPGPKTAALKLPLGPHGATGSAAFAAFATQRPATAPP